MITTPHWQDADTFYEQLLDAQAGLSPEQLQAFSARLILLLANQVGDAVVLAECIQAAREAACAAEQIDYSERFLSCHLLFSCADPLALLMHICTLSVHICTMPCTAVASNHNLSIKFVRILFYRQNFLASSGFL